jgi:acyl-CoA thioesterase-1
MVAFTENRLTRAFAVLTVVLGSIAQDTRVGAGQSRPQPDKTPVIVVFGDSLTSGPGLDRDDTYPALLQEKVDDNDYEFRVVNAGVSGDTTTEALTRLDAALVPEARVLILALGMNDGLRGVPVATVERNLAAIIERARSRQLAVLLCQMEAPPLDGFKYTVEFHRLYARLATRFDVPLVPFFLFGIAGDPRLNMPDRIHPNADGHKLIAEAIWSYLEPLLMRPAA